MTTIDGFTGDGGDDDFRLTMMDNDLVSMFKTSFFLTDDEAK